MNYFISRRFFDNSTSLIDYNDLLKDFLFNVRKKVVYLTDLAILSTL